MKTHYKYRLRQLWPALGELYFWRDNKEKVNVAKSTLPFGEELKRHAEDILRCSYQMIAVPAALVIPTIGAHFVVTGLEAFLQ